MAATSFADRLRERGWVLQNHGKEGELGRCLVYRVSDSDGRRFAIKRIRPQHISSVSYNELTVLNLMRNPRPEAAVQYHEVWQDEEGIVIRMDEHNGTLRRWIKPTHLLSDYDWFPIMLGIATRLTNSHAAGLIHADLKPSNILVDRTVDSHDFVPDQIYISDFGTPYCSRLPIGDKSIDVPGTLPYLAPELRQYGIGSTRETDIWAVGCIGYELCIGKKLAENFEPLEDYMAAARRNSDAINTLLDTIPKRFTKPVREVIAACLRLNSNSRCKAVDLRNFLQECYQNLGT